MIQITYNHQDHLGSTAAVTSDIGYMTRLYNYYPYGQLRLDEGSTSTIFVQSNQFIGQNRDAEADLSYLNARYYSSNNGQFTSQDPVFLGDPKAQDLKNPQNLNSYSYGTNNPIAKKDPDGKAAYKWNNGAEINGTDTWNTNTYYEYQDQAMLAKNAAYAESNIGNVYAFYQQVKPGGEWDYKRNLENRGFYFFNGRLVSSEEFGNLNYGYTGTAFGLGAKVLSDAGGLVQVVTSGRDNRGPSLNNPSGNFDDPRDTNNIKSGVSSYNKSGNSNSSKATAQISNVAYKATLSKIVSALTLAVAALKSSKANQEKNK